jgi:hypothetical protein
MNLQVFKAQLFSLVYSNLGILTRKAIEITTHLLILILPEDG